VPNASKPLAWQRQLILDTIVIGIAGALAAQLFNAALRGVNALFLEWFAGYHAPGLPSEGGTLTETIGAHGLWLVPVSLVVGALIVGVIVVRFAPEAEGHGTDAVVRAFHRADGKLRGRVAPVKLVASALTIGSGGSAGREGPVALTTAALGSWFASLRDRDAEDRRLLLLMGMAAGLSASFRSPIGTAILAIEVLYAEMEFEPGALLYTTLASIVAYAVNGFFVGWDPLFAVPDDIGKLLRPVEYGWFVVLGIGAGILATAFPMLFYGVRDRFRGMRVHRMLKPAVGAALTGVIVLAVPQVIAGGYGWMQLAIDGRLTLATLATVTIAKMFATSFTVASGGSGGVFAPSLYVGAMLGGALAAAPHVPAAPFEIVGMAAVFAGAGRVPIATMMMVTEMTGGYTLLVPAATSVMLSYLVQTRLSHLLGLKHRSLYEAQVQGRADSPAHHKAHLAIALQLIKERNLRPTDATGEIDLVSLLQSGIPVDLPAGRRLSIGVVPKDSALIGMPAAGSGTAIGGAQTSIVAIIRGEHMLVPRPDTVLETGDRLIVISAADELGAVTAALAPW